MEENAEFEAYEEEDQEDNSNQLKKLTKMVADLGSLVVQEQMLMERVNVIQARRKQFEENFIPELMIDLGLEHITTAGGLSVQLKKEVRASFPKDIDRRARIMEWLRETGNDGIIKNMFKISYGKDAIAEADKLSELLEEAGIAEHATIERDLTIHHQTLLAFLREQLAKGANVPMEDFGAIEQKTAKIKQT